MSRFGAGVSWKQSAYLVLEIVRLRVGFGYPLIERPST